MLLDVADGELMYVGITSLTLLAVLAYRIFSYSLLRSLLPYLILLSRNLYFTTDKIVSGGKCLLVIPSFKWFVCGHLKHGILV